MIIYRITGRAERFPRTGRTIADPVVGSNLKALTKTFHALVAEYKQKGLSFVLKLQELTTKDVDQKLVLELLASEMTELLIAHVKVLDVVDYVPTDAPVTVTKAVKKKAKAKAKKLTEVFADDLLEADAFGDLPF